MADITNLEDFLQDVADAIKEKKNYSASQKIAAEDFDTEIATIETGIDTSDATAEASDIKAGKTAYVQGEKIEGIHVDEDLEAEISAQETYISQLEAIIDEKAGKSEAFPELIIPNSLNVQYTRKSEFDMELPDIDDINWKDVLQVVKKAIRVKGEDEWHYTDWEDEETGEYEEMCMDIYSQFSGEEDGNLSTIIGFNEDDEKYHINLDIIHIYKENYEDYDFKLLFKILDPTTNLYKNADINFNITTPTDVIYSLYIRGTGISAVGDVDISVKDTNDNDIPYNAQYDIRFNRIRLSVQTDKDGEISVTYNGSTQTRILDTTNNLSNEIYTYSFSKLGEDIDFDN